MLYSDEKKLIEQFSEFPDSEESKGRMKIQRKHCRFSARRGKIYDRPTLGNKQNCSTEVFDIEDRDKQANNTILKG